MFQLTGKTIGSYRVLEQIGVGGMAMVYKAYHPGMDRYVAIKVLPPHLSQDPDFIKRFQREARAITKLEHAHILPVHDYGEYEGVTYIAMRYVEAGTLKDRITARRFSLDEINHIISQIGGALDYAHRMGVIHRDVKPGNVLVDDQGDTYLTDFGLARMMEPTEKLTGSGVGLGTPAYMSPEQGVGDKVDHRSDIYSLGVILYEMVTGHVPYEAETPMAIVLKHINDELPLPRAIDPSVSTSIERVILKALAKDPADRYQTAGEMVQALVKATREAGVKPEEEPAPVQVKPAPPREDISLITRVQQTWAQPRGKVMLAGGGLAIVVALGFLLTWLLPTPVAIVSPEATMTPVMMTQTSSPNEPALVPTSIQTTIPEITAEPVEVPESVGQGETLTVCDGDICVCKGDNCSPTGLSDTYTNFDSSHLSWSPDGSAFAFTACTLEFVLGNPDMPCPAGTYVVHRDGTDIIRASYDPDDTHRVPSWSPDGNWIAFSPSCNLSVVHPDGTGQRVLVPYNGLDCPWAIAWSPDSRRIAWIGGMGGATTTSTYVWVTNSDGSNAKIVFYSPEVELVAPIAWNPSGDSVAVTLQNGKRYLIDADCQGGVAGCDESSRMEIPDIPMDWLHNFYPQWNSAVLYEEDFEDGILQDAVLTSEITRWQIVKDETGNMVHRIDNRDGPNFAWMEFGSEEWKDYAVEFRMRILTPESDRWGVVMHFRNDTIGNSYILDISPEIPSSGVMQLAMTLNNNPWVVLKSENTKNTADIWHTVRQEVDQDQIRTYFDGQLVIDVTDSQIQQGHVVLGAGPGAYIEFDDVRVTLLDSLTSQAE